MPSSPIGKKASESIKMYEHLNKVIIPDRATDHYYSIWYSNPTEIKRKGNRMGKYTSKTILGVETVIGTKRVLFDADLMCCQMDDNPTEEHNWYHVEDLEKDHYNVLDTIKAVFGISFHDSIWKEISPEQIAKDNPII